MIQYKQMSYVNMPFNILDNIINNTIFTLYLHGSRSTIDCFLVNPLEGKKYICALIHNKVIGNVNLKNNN